MGRPYFPLQPRSLRPIRFTSSVTQSLTPLPLSFTTHSSRNPQLPGSTISTNPSTPSFLSLLQSPTCICGAVTKPHKVTFLSQVDHLTEEARMIEAINTVFKRRNPGGEVVIIGTNTDTIGMREAFLQNHPEILERCKGRPALVVGSGGACRSTAYALWKWLGVSKIYMVNRLELEVLAIQDSFKAAEGFDGQLVWVGGVTQGKELEKPMLVVGTVPDVVPKEEGEILAREIVKVFLGKDEENGVALEMCYHPSSKTAFAGLVVENGWEVIPGTESMIHQGVAQQVLWREELVSGEAVIQAEKVVKVALEKH